MKKLLVIANPNKQSFSHAMAEKYREKAEKNGESYKVLDLYDTKQGYLEYKNIEALKKGEITSVDVMKNFQKDIMWADELSFFFPIWWGGMPAILKNFFDTNFSAGFAFQFIAGKSAPKKLLTGKTAKVFCSCDAPGIIYKFSPILGIGLKKSFKSAILGFCGIKLTTFQLVGSLRKQTQEKKKQILEKIAQ